MTPKSPVKKTPVPGSVRPNNQPPGVNDGRNKDSVTRSRSVSVTSVIVDWQRS